MCYQEIYLVAGQINEVKKQNVLLCFNMCHGNFFYYDIWKVLW